MHLIICNFSYSKRALRSDSRLKFKIQESIQDSPGKKMGVDCHSLLQEIFPTQGSNRGLPKCRQVLHHLSHQGSFKIQKQIRQTVINVLKCKIKQIQVITKNSFYKEWTTNLVLRFLVNNTKVKIDQLDDNSECLLLIFPSEEGKPKYSQYSGQGEFSIKA